MDNTKNLLICGGFDLPKKLLDLMEQKDSVDLNLKRMQNYVTLFNETMAKLKSYAPTGLAMASYINKMKTNIQFSYQMYASSTLVPFIEEKERTIRFIQNAYKLVKTDETIASEKLITIENLTLFPVDFDDIQKISVMSHKFNIRGIDNLMSISREMYYMQAALNNIEWISLRTKTKCHENMRLYYEKYQNDLYDTFSSMVMKNYQKFLEMVEGDRPICIIEVQFLHKSFSFTHNIREQLLKALDDVTRHLKSIPKSVGKNIIYETMDDIVLDNCYDPVMDREHINDKKKACITAVKRLDERLTNEFQSYQEFRFPINGKVDVIIDKFVATKPTYNDYDDYFKYFTEKLELFDKNQYLNVACVSIDLLECRKFMQERCLFWHTAFGNRLIQESDKEVTTFLTNFTKLTEQLRFNFKDIFELQIVVDAIRDVKNIIFDVEFLQEEVRHRFELLEKYNITVPDENKKNYDDFKNNWITLHREALKKQICYDKALAANIRTHEND